MVQKVAAPKTYKPSGGRPVERLAYLNESEMEFLRQFNGDNVERGPKGIPSFADDSASSNGVSRGDSSGTRGSSSTMSNSPQSGGRGAGSNYGGGSGRPGTTSGGGGLGQGGQGGSSSASRGAGNSSPSGSRTSGPSSSTASQSKGPSGPTSPMGGQGASFSTPKAASSYNKDESIKNSLQKRDAINSIKNTPAIRNDGVTGFKAQALGVRPTGAIREAAPVTITPPPKLAGHPVNNEMEVNRNLAKITDSFYASDFDTGMAVSRLQNAEKAARESLGMYGKSQTAQPRDKLSAPARTATSTGITPSERQALSPYGLAQSAIGGISSLAGKVYNDPVGVAASGINALGNYAKDAYQTIAMASDPRYSSYPEVQRAAAEKAAEIALNYGIGTSATSFASGAVPKNSLGSLIVGRSSMDPAIQRQFQAYDNAIRKGATPAQAFEESKKGAPSYAGGVVEVISDVPKSPNLPVKYAQAVEIDEPFSLRSSGIVSDIAESIAGKKPLDRVYTYNQVFKPGPVTVSDPNIMRSVIYNDPQYGNYNPKRGGVLGYFSAPGGIQPGLGQIATPAELFSAVKYGGTAIQTPTKLNFAERLSGNPDLFRETATHETVHRTAYNDAAANVRNPVPQGTSTAVEEANIRYEISRGVLPQMTESQIQALAQYRYTYSPGEWAARFAEQTMGRPVSQMRDYNSRFGNPTFEDLKNIMSYGTSEP